MANLIRNRWLWLALLGAALLFALASGKRLPGPTMVHAAGAGSVSFSPVRGGAGDVRFVSFSGFAAGETDETSRTVVTGTFSIA